TVTLKDPAPAGGARISLTSTNTSVASLDSIVVVPEGATSTTFHVQTYSTPINIGVGVSAVWGPWSAATSFTVVSVPPPPSISVSPTGWQVAQQAVGTPSAPQVVAIRNNGAVPLILYPITTSGPFSQTNNCPSTLAPSAACSVSVVYTPTAPTQQSGTLT